MRTKEQQKEYMKGYMQRKRANTGANKDGVLTEGANRVETVPASYVDGVKGRYQFLPERPRFVTLSD